MLISALSAVWILSVLGLVSFFGAIAYQFYRDLYATAAPEDTPASGRGTVGACCGKRTLDHCGKKTQALC